MALFIPVQGVSLGQLTDTFGAPRSGGRSHRGIDIFASRGTPVLAASSGTVIRTSPSNRGLGGITATVQGDDGRFYYYAHLSSLGVRPGQRVNAGQSIGGVGNTGNAASTPPHLHFSVGSGGVEDGSINAFQALRGAQAGQGQAAAGGFQQQAVSAAAAQQERVMSVIRMMQEQMRNRGQARMPEFAPVPTAAFEPGQFAQALGRVGEGVGPATPNVARGQAPARGGGRPALEQFRPVLRQRQEEQAEEQRDENDITLAGLRLRR